MSTETEKRILMIAATPFFSDRGGHIRIYSEIKYLLKNNFKVILCTYFLGNNPVGIDTSIIKRSLNFPWYKKVSPGASWHKIYLDFFLLFSTLKVYFKFRPHLIHAHMYEGLVIAWIVKLFSFKKIKIVFDCQGSLSEEIREYTSSKKTAKIFYPFFVFIEKILLFIPDTILCSSQNSYNILTVKFKVDYKKIDILSDGVDEELFIGIKDELFKEELKIKLGIPANNKVIVYTGSLSEAKGVDDVLAEMPRLLEVMEKVTFVFAGYGDLEEYYKKKYKNYVQNGKIVFLGGFSYFDLQKYLGIADFAIDPKKNSSESSGKIFNYMKFGLPIICFKNKFNYALLGNHGVYVNNFMEISRILTKEYKKINYNNLSYSWDKTIIKLIDKYKKLL